MIEDQNQDTLCYIGNVKLLIDSLDILEKKFHFGNLRFEDSKINIIRESKGYNYQFLLGFGESKTEVTSHWEISFVNFDFLNSSIKHKDLTVKDTLVNGINFNNLEIKKLNVSLTKVHSTDSITTFFVDNASIGERSGLSIGDLRFAGRIDPSGFELSNLTLVSNHSHIEATKIKISKNELFNIDSLYSERSQTLTNRYVIDSEFKESVLSLADLSYVIPEIWGMDEPILY